MNFRYSKRQRAQCRHIIGRLDGWKLLILASTRCATCYRFLEKG